MDPSYEPTQLYAEALALFLHTPTIDRGHLGGVLEGSGSHFGVCLSPSCILIASHLDERLWFLAR